MPRQKKQEAAVEAARLRELLEYDAETGLFRWRVNKSSAARAGDIAGSRHNKEYLCIRIDGVSYLCHRLAWLYAYGVWPIDQLDHVNGRRADNRLCNLRECSNAQNCQNVRSHRDGTSQYIGVSWNTEKRKWMAQLTVNGKRVLRKMFRTEDAAMAAYVFAKRKHHPFYGEL